MNLTRWSSSSNKRSQLMVTNLINIIITITITILLYIKRRMAIFIAILQYDTDSLYYHLVHVHLVASIFSVTKTISKNIVAFKQRMQCLATGLHSCQPLFHLFRVIITCHYNFIRLPRISAITNQLLTLFQFKIQCILVPILHLDRNLDFFILLSTSEKCHIMAWCFDWTPTPYQFIFVNGQTKIIFLQQKVK